jgi:hypothetical protein
MAIREAAPLPVLVHSLAGWNVLLDWIHFTPRFLHFKLVWDGQASNHA